MTSIRIAIRNVICLIVLFTGCSQNTLPQILYTINQGDTITIVDDSNRVGVWNLRSEEVDWVPKVSGESTICVGRHESDEVAYFLTQEEKRYAITPRLKRYTNGNFTDLGEWKKDGRQDYFIAVSADYLCGFRILGHYSSDNAGASRICEFYKLQEASFEFDHQFLGYREFSAGNMVSVSPSQVIVHLISDSNAATQKQKLCLYDFRERRILEVTDTEIELSSVAMQASRIAKRLVITDTKKLTVVETAHCSQKLSYDLVEFDLKGTFSAAISDDARYAVVAADKVVLIDVEDESASVIDKLSSSVIDSNTPLTKPNRNGLVEAQTEGGARLALCCAGVSFIPESDRFVVLMHSGEIHFWKAETRKKIKTTHLK